MTHYKPGLYDRCRAEILSAGSAIANTVPRIGQVAGQQQAPPQVLTRWNYVRGIRSDAVDSWQVFVGDKEDHRKPPYQRVAMITVAREVMHSYLRESGDRQAVAYALGTAIMIGTTEVPEFFGLDPEDPDRYAVGMGVDREALQATIAVRHADGRIDFPDSIGSGPVLAVAAWPANIPRV